MTTRQLAITAIALWFVTAAAALVLFVHGRTAPASDGRTAILLTPGERDLVLGEMRALLTSVHGIMNGLSKNDLNTVAEAAKAAGMAAAHEVPPGLIVKLPLNFKQLGMDTHANFDAIAAGARQGETADMLGARLAAQLGNCVACHATYRLEGAAR